MRLALIDHYDSFTFNVLEWLAAADPTLEILHVAHDDAEAMAALTATPVPLVLGPGPNRPTDVPASLRLAQDCLGKVPILGICLGAQILGSLAGAAVVRSSAPFHGTARRMRVTVPTPLLAGFGREFSMGVYHSLVVAGDLAAPWRVHAVDELGEIQVIAREPPGEAPAYGVQFHPESHLSADGARLAANWLALARHASATLPLSIPS